MYSRRDFARMAVAGIPLSRALAAAAGVRIGATTFSFREFPRTPGQDNVDAVIAALRFAGVTEVDLHSADTEAPVTDARLPAPGAVDAYSGAVRPITPEDLAAAKKAVRDSFRKWRLYTPDRYYTAIRAKFDPCAQRLRSLLAGINAASLAASQIQTALKDLANAEAALQAVATPTTTAKP